MPAKARPAKGSAANGATLGFEAKLWKTADALRNNMDAAEYKHVVLGLIFLKYISDAFDSHRTKLEAEAAEGADPEEPDEYRGANVFWVPPSARWDHLKAQAKQPTIGETVDDAMDAIERENPLLKGVLPRDYARPGLDKTRLGQIIDLISGIGLGDAESRSKDILGRVYEYFLSQFASAEGKKGGQFYTPSYVVRLLVEMLTPYGGRVLDPCCGSGGMFVQSEKFVEAHGGNTDVISIYGQESNYTTWRLCNMNLAIRGIAGQIAHGDSFHNDGHADLKADYVLANGSMSSSQSGEGEIRKAIVEADLVDCMVALPGQLFYSTQIPVCLWFVAREKRNGRRSDGKGPKFRDRRGETLFIDARKMGTLVDRVHRELTDGDIAKIAGTYHAWRGDGETEYENVPGFCRAATLDDMRGHGHVLTPGRYVGAEAAEDDGEPFEEKMLRLTTQLSEQTEQGRRLDEAINANLRELRYDR